MAFNVETFKTRSLTAIVFVIVMLAGLLVNNWSFFILFSVVNFGCWFEYQKLIALIDPGYKDLSFLHKYGVPVLGWSFMMFMTNSSYHIGHTPLKGLGFFVLMVLGILLMAVEIVFVKKLNTKKIGYSILGLLYISLSWGLMMNLRNIGWVIPVVLIAAIWINDTMAYIVGSFIGKTPFSKISPKKTWEGTIGGMILCVLVIGFGVPYFLEKGSYYEYQAPYLKVNWFVIATIAAIAGTVGDLLESKIKRMANVKDSGSIMPGHGGFLDRFDSLVLATPFVWLYISLILKII